MPPEVTRELSVIYGTFEVGGTTERLLDGPIRITRAYTTASVEFAFVIQKDTEADFATEVGLVEAAYRSPRQDLSVTQGVSTIAAYSHGGNTGFKADPEILKQEDISDTGRSRRYEVRINFEMPADLAGQAGRRESTVELEFTESRRRVLIVSGVYTAFSSDARTQYNNNIDAYVSAIISALGGVYELAEEKAENDDDPVAEGKILVFRRVYEEVIFNQTISVLDDPAIVRQGMLVRRNRVGPGDSVVKGQFGALGPEAAAAAAAVAAAAALAPSPGGSTQDEGGGGVGRSSLTTDAKRLVRMTVQYEASIDLNVTTDLKGKWEGTIKPWILQNITTILGTARGALVSEEPEFDGPQNRIVATMEFLGVDKASRNFVEFEFTQEIRLESGINLIPVWDGNPFAKYQIPGPARRILQLKQRIRKLGGGQNVFGGGGSGGGFVIGPGQQFAGGAFPGLTSFGVGGGLLAKSPASGAFFAFPGVNKPGAGGGEAPGPFQFKNVQKTGWNHMTSRRAETPLRLGIDQQLLDVTDIEQVDIFEWADAPASGGGGGGNPTVASGSVS